MESDLHEDDADDLVYQFAASPSAWYAACGSGLYRSVDRGVSWQPAYESLGVESPLATLAVAVAIGPESTPTVFGGLSGELLRSAGDGSAWELAPKPSPGPIYTALVPAPDYPREGRLFAGTISDGVLIYSDYGRAWMMWNFGLLDTHVLCLAVSPAFGADQTIFAGVQSGLFRSATGGRSWSEVELPTGYTAVLSLALSPNFAEDGLLYAGTEEHGLLRSADRGRSWLHCGVLTEPINSILIGPQFPERPELLVLHGDGLWYSPNGGDTWAPWRAERTTGMEITAVMAPHGFGDQAPVLVGLAGGDMRLI